MRFVDRRPGPFGSFLYINRELTGSPSTTASRSSESDAHPLLERVKSCYRRQQPRRVFHGARGHARPPAAQRARTCRSDGLSASQCLTMGGPGRKHARDIATAGRRRCARACGPKTHDGEPSDYSPQIHEFLQSTSARRLHRVTPLASIPAIRFLYLESQPKNFAVVVESDGRTRLPREGADVLPRFLRFPSVSGGAPDVRVLEDIIRLTSPALPRMDVVDATCFAYPETDIVLGRRRRRSARIGRSGAS